MAHIVEIVDAGRIIDAALRVEGGDKDAGLGLVLERLTLRKKRGLCAITFQLR
jgi:hypothetical protein